MAKILLIDDEPELLEIMGDRLEDDGYTVVKCGGTPEAIEAIKLQKFDLLLCDYTMPCGGFLNLVNVLSQTQLELPKIAIISGHAKGDFVKSLSVPVVKIFEKPINFENFSDEVAKLIS